MNCRAAGLAVLLLGGPLQIGSAQSPAGKNAPSPFGHTPSSRITLDRELEEQFTQLDQQIEKAEWPVVAESLLRLLQSPPTQRVAINGITRSICNQAWRLLQRLPPEGLEVYRRDGEPLAAAALQSALNHSSLAELKEVARQFPMTPSGEVAGASCREALRDRGMLPEYLRAESPNVLSAGDPQHAQAVSAPEYTSRFPSRQSAWTSAIPVREQQVRDFKAHQLPIRRNGQIPWLSGTMADAAAGEILITASMFHLSAWDSKTGSAVWTVSRSDAQNSQLESNSRQRFPFQTPTLNSDPWRGGLFHQVQAQGELLFAIERQTPDPNANKAARSFILPMADVVCRNVRDSAVIWRFSGGASDQQSVTGLLLDGPHVYVTSENRTSSLLTLFQLDRLTGQVLHAMPLCQFAFPLSEDPLRGETFCPILRHGDELFCTTRSGQLIQVNLDRQEVGWVYGYPRTDVLEGKIRNLPRQARATLFGIGSGSQHPRLLWAVGRLVFTSPESNQLHVLDAGTGALLWKRMCPDLLTVAAADSQIGVVWLDEHRAQAAQLENGQTLWTCAVPPAAGEGCRFGEAYLYPSWENEMARLQLDGSGVTLSEPLQIGARLLEADQIVPPIRSRNVFWRNHALYETDFQSLRRMQLPEPVDSVSGDTFAGGLAAWEAGDLNAAQTSLEAVLAQSASHGSGAEGISESDTASEALNESDGTGTERAKARVLLLRVLVAQYQQSTEADQRELAAEIEPLLNGSRDVAAWRLIQIEQAIEHQDFATLLALWLQVPADDTQWLVTSDAGERRTRLDRWIAQRIDEVFNPLSNEGQREFDAQLARAFDGLWQHDAEERWRLASLIAPTRWRGELFDRDMPEPTDLQQYMQLQMWAQAATNSSDADGQRWGWEQLLQLYETHHRQHDAARVRNELAALKAANLDAPRAAGSTSALDLTRGQVGRQFEEAWGNATPRVSIKHRNFRAVYYWPILLQAEAGSFLESTQMEMDWPGMQLLRLNNSHRNHPWFAEILPSDIPLYREYKFYHAWGIEELLVWQAGDRLQGASPFRLNGDRGCEPVWSAPGDSIDLLGRSDSPLPVDLDPWLLESSPPSRIGFPAASERVLNRFKFSVAEVGPIRAGYVCYQQQGMLVAINSATGAEIWRRYDLPRRAECFGDDEIVVVASRDSDAIQILSAFDGRLLQQETRRWPLEAVVRAQGLQVMTIEGGRRGDKAGSEPQQPEVVAPLKMSRTDILNNQAVWTRTWPVDAVPFQMDDRWIGVLQSTGNLEIVELRTGQTVRTQLVNVPEQIDRVVCHAGEHDFLIAISGPVTDESLTMVPQPLKRFRREFVRGPIVCLRRDDGALLWQAELSDTTFPWEQPPDLPVFVLAESRFPETPMDQTGPFSGNPQGFVTRLTCYDRRTGQKLYQLNSGNLRDVFYSIVGDRETGQVILRMQHLRVELDFSSIGASSSTTPSFP